MISSFLGRQVCRKEMAFSQSSRNIHLDGHYLKAECEDLDGTYWPSKINLNSCIVNHDGKLEWSPGGNFGSCSCGLRLDGTYLVANCKKISGEEVTGSINLDEHITNTDACLMFQRPRPGGFSNTSYDIHLAGTQLRAMCRDKWGHSRYSTFELGDFIGNVNGCLEWVDTGFGDTKGIHLIGSRLHAQARSNDGSYYCTAINLDEHVVNINGSLQMHMDKVLMKVTNDNVNDVTRVLDNYYKSKSGFQIDTQLAEEGDLKVCPYSLSPLYTPYVLVFCSFCMSAVHMTKRQMLEYCFNLVLNNRLPCSALYKSMGDRHL